MYVKIMIHVQKNPQRMNTKSCKGENFEGNFYFFTLEFVVFNIQILLV